MYEASGRGTRSGSSQPPAAAPEVVAVDLVIIGAGPAGLFAAFYAGLRGLRVAIVDALGEAGGQLAALYPHKPIHDVAGLPGVLAKDLVARLREQAATFDPRWLLGRHAVRLDGDAATGFRLTCNDDTVVASRGVIVTAGIGGFQPRPLPAARGYRGGNVVPLVHDPSAFIGKRVVIVGGGDSAVDWALLLAHAATSVTVVHRRADFRAHAASVAQLEGVGVRVCTPYAVRSLVDGPDGTTLTVTLERVGTREPLVLEADVLVPALGFVADLGPILSWGLQLDGRGILVDTTMATSRPGVFAAGDVAAYPGKVALIAVAFGEAATAVNNAAVLLDPAAHLFPGHSTDLPTQAEPHR